MAAKKKTTRTFTNCFDQTFTVSTKKQPAKKAKRKAREWDAYLWPQDGCLRGYRLTKQDEKIRVREVLPRTSTRKGER